MKRRNFLTLFPLAGFAAAFGIKLKAEPVFMIPDVSGVVLKGIVPDDIQKMKPASGSIVDAVYGGISYGPDEKNWPYLFFCEDIN